MPTSYTAAVQSGTVTDFNEFAMQCARAFGALITMRDDRADAAIPDAFEPQTKYHDERLAAAKARAIELLAMDYPAIAKAAEADYDAAVLAAVSRELKRIVELERYSVMLSKVEAWEPPTADHSDMKAFMIQQLKDSMDHDCTRYDHDDVKMSTPNQWMIRQLRQVERDIAYHTKNVLEEIARTASRNEWVAALRASLATAEA
jgi:hypothetical protein